MRYHTLSYFFSILLLFLFSLHAYPQCEPLSAEECPDPENNGEICPDTLAVGFMNQFYSVTATVLPPLTDTNGIPLHHITIVSVDNLPPGVTWVSNAPNNEFLAGNYYCILMEGTPTASDTFYLKIIVDVYVDILGFPVFVTQIVDSTSLSIIILDNTAIAESRDKAFYIAGNHPNPFTSWVSIEYFSESPGTVAFELYSMVGEMVDSRTTFAGKGKNYLHYPGEDLPPGTYFYLLRTDNTIASGKIIRGQ